MLGFMTLQHRFVESPRALDLHNIEFNKNKEDTSTSVFLMS
jgi:hypothetical protein